jgi:hypothetical protein
MRLLWCGRPGDEAAVDGAEHIERIDCLIRRIPAPADSMPQQKLSGSLVKNGKKG